MEWTESFIDKEDPSQPRVTELQRPYSTCEESQVPDNDQEGDQRIHYAQGSASLSRSDGVASA